MWEEYVEGACALYVPPLAQEYGCPVAIETTYAHGGQGYLTPDGTHYDGPYKPPSDR